MSVYAAKSPPTRPARNVEIRRGIFLAVMPPHQRCRYFCFYKRIRTGKHSQSIARHFFTEVTFRIFKFRWQKYPAYRSQSGLKPRRKNPSDWHCYRCGNCEVGARACL